MAFPEDGKRVGWIYKLHTCLGRKLVTNTVAEKPKTKEVTCQMN
jgi:hypothetical protein